MPSELPSTQKPGAQGASQTAGWNIKLSARLPEFDNSLSVALPKVPFVRCKRSPMATKLPLIVSLLLQKLSMKFWFGGLTPAAQVLSLIHI